MKQYRGILWFAAGAAIMLAAGWIAFPFALYKSTDQPIQFSHKLHTGESVGLTCESCHSYRDDGEFNGIPTLDQCAACHASQVGTSEEEKKLVDNYITPHREIPWLVYARQPENVYFSHIQHVRTAALPCERCHGAHGSSDRLQPLLVDRISGYSRDIAGGPVPGRAANPSDGMTMDDCMKCHEQQSRATSCIDCHK